MMTRFTLAIITALAALTPNAAASACTTFTQARASHPNTYIVYRLEHRQQGGRKCWYLPAKSSRGGVERDTQETGTARRAVRAGGSTRGDSRLRNCRREACLAAGVAPGPRETVYEIYAGEAPGQATITADSAMGEVTRNSRTSTTARPASPDRREASRDAGMRQDHTEGTTRASEVETPSRRGEPAPHDRVDDTFTTINYFTTMPWHDDLWLRIQIGWLHANGAFDSPTRWVMTSRWP